MSTLPKTVLRLMLWLFLPAHPHLAHAVTSAAAFNPAAQAPGFIWWGGAVLLANGVFLVIWNAAMNRQVKSKIGRLEAEIAHSRASAEELRESERKIRAMFDQAAVGVGQVCTKSGRFTGINQKFCDILGYSPEEMLQLDAQDITHPDDIQATNDNLERLRSGAVREFSVEKRYQHRDGHLVWVNLTISPMWKEGGEPDYHLAIVQDITASKLMARAMAKNEVHLKTLLQTLPDLVWLKDADGVYLFCNAMFERFFGAGEADIVGKTDYDFVNSELADFFREYDRKAMAAGESGSNEEWVTFACDGRRALLETVKTPMYDPAGELIGVLGIGRDITERKNAEERQLNLERQLLHSQKLESLGVLSGGIAHDFNNLLVAVLGNLELALRRLPEGSAAGTNIERAVNASKHAAKLTNMMLAYSGKGNFIVKELKLNELVEENATMLATAVARTVELDLQLDPLLPPVMADAAQLQQVVMNLITNASEAIDGGKGSITLSTGVQDFDQSTLNGSRLEEKLAAGRYVWLKVRDSGCGMDEETQYKLFEPFFTTKFTGRGLGMSAVLGIIRAHKGAFLVESSPGAGTTMLVVLPIAAQLQQALCGVPADAAPPERLQHPGIILIVDDEEYVREACAAMVAELGFKTLLAADGAEALSIFAAQGGAISLVLLDQSMPRMDGESVIRELRLIQPDVRVLLASGYSELDIAERYSGLGLNDFIQKPFSMECLERQIQRVLQA